MSHRDKDRRKETEFCHEKPKMTVIEAVQGFRYLDSLRKKDVGTTAIVTVADDGGSSEN